MSKRWVLVKNGVVENIVIADDDFANGYLSQNYDRVETFADESQEPRIGWLYVDGEYHEPNWNEPEPAPQGGQ